MWGIGMEFRHLQIMKTQTANRLYPGRYMMKSDPCPAPTSTGKLLSWPAWRLPKKKVPLGPKPPKHTYFWGSGKHYNRLGLWWGSSIYGNCNVRWALTKLVRAQTPVND